MSGFFDKLKFWKRYRFNPKKIFPFGSSENAKTADYDKDLTGLQLRLFAKKSNKYIGQHLPQSGICIKKITVGGDPHWYVFQLNNPVPYGAFHSYLIAIRHKKSGETLENDKIEIYYMLTPDEQLFMQDEVDIKRLRFVGPAYSRPLNTV